jgi:hypothetical protein
VGKYDGTCERLQAGARLARRDHAIDGAAVIAIVVIAGSFPREPFAGRVIENGDGDVVRAGARERRSLCANDVLDVALEFGVERGHNTRS